MTNEIVPRAISIKDAALRYSVSRTTLYKLLTQRRIRDCKICGRRLVLVSDLEALLGMEG
ncbi:helix-turn-helix domain-containing protein [Xanthobacter autotrophicus]|uniref:helix-turn-helix domain-containing protein n=1 Tax=Xanthobacter autotrophicus TaxID=280 RepID=UPI0037370BE9